MICCVIQHEYRVVSPVVTTLVKQLDYTKEEVIECLAVIIAFSHLEVYLPLTRDCCYDIYLVKSLRFIWVVFLSSVTPTLLEVITHEYTTLINIDDVLRKTTLVYKFFSCEVSSYYTFSIVSSWVNLISFLITQTELLLHYSPKLSLSYTYLEFILELV